MVTKTNTIRKIVILAGLPVLLILIALVWISVAVPQPVLAASVNSDQQNLFDNQICPALEQIKGEKLFSYCKNYASQKDLDNAEKKICDKYGNAQLKIQCSAYASAKKPATSPPAPVNCTESNCDLVGTYINPLINALSVLFGFIAVISLILGGIQYTTSGGDPQQAAKARSRLTNTIFAIVAYVFLYAFLQFLVPGGIFH